jgi:F0F1-type ATP synthase membrane subunit b/b'
MERNSPDAAIARAIERVLAAERDAADAIAAAQREAEAVIEAARAERRRLLERARVRSARLHAAAQQRLARSLDRLEHGAGASALDLDTLDSLTRRAVARLAQRLTAADHEQD